MMNKPAGTFIDFFQKILEDQYLGKNITEFDGKTLFNDMPKIVES